MARWLSWEFLLIWYVIIAYFFTQVVPQGCMRLLALCESDVYCLGFMRPSLWRANYEMDNGDIQWREFRCEIHLLSLAAAAYVVLRAAFGRRRTWPCLMLSLAFVGYLHGGHTIFLLVACSGSYAVARAFGASKWAPVAAWAYGLSLIGFKVLNMQLKLAWVLGPVGKSLDNLPRAYDWHQSLSLMVLRLISFNMDYYWALKAVEGGAPQHEVPATADSEALTYKLRERRPRPVADYSLANCIAHAFYAPLWLAGPTMSFNVFASHLRDREQEAVRGWRLLLYGFRLVVCLALLEFVLHVAPVFALGRSKAYERLLRGDGEADLAALYVFMILNVMWLKFLVIWRFARLWALCDGFECIENMQRCVCNNYSIIGFWKGWHVSFNRWLVRYLYVPLGGRKWRWANVWLVFGFVAIWHDAEVKLLAWGMLNAGFLAMEHLAGSFWQSSTLAPLRARPELARWVRCAAGTTYIYVMLFVNLVGYGIGVGGSLSVTGAAFFGNAGQGLKTLLGSYIILFSGVQVMLELRACGISRDAGDEEPIKAT
ncbi:unnamed protein product [Polarella glacialis]|uniref:Uncharacterized protein n=1 Tax=Polarella glacialis TaxID=89957 RepID=A0A813IBL5_POLGL|nr:unnamed protein product [Polarella glacialis]